MLGDLEKIDDTLEPGGASELWSDVGKADREYGLDFDFTLFHTVAIAHRNVWTLPDADAAGDLASPHSVAQPLREDHRRTLLRLGLRRRCSHSLMSAEHRG